METKMEYRGYHNQNTYGNNMKYSIGDWLRYQNRNKGFQELFLLFLTKQIKIDNSVMETFKEDVRTYERVSSYFQFLSKVETNDKTKYSY